MSAPPTPLQGATRSLLALLADASETLDEGAYETFIAIAVAVIEREADRLLVGEALRALREPRS